MSFSYLQFIRLSIREGQSNSGKKPSESWTSFPRVTSGGKKDRSAVIFRVKRAKKWSYF